MRKKLLVLTLVFAVLFSGFGFESTFKENKASASSRWENIDHISKGWRIRLDDPVGGGKYHVHIYDKKAEIAVENVDGTPSHGQTFDDCINPKLAKKVRATKLYQKGLSLQKSKDKSNKKPPRKKR
ncbi:hypothetical protein [Bacillus badius]|uniref:hypothetical protein n=1 Tax=Bacillus badius TaxID=1455 RepID=UPI000698E7DC|nr:hypothetical protein [Bacillus badius]KZN98241.1 hypothetical protein A4244_10825 [Bacillus badius]KZR58527.1 hypothetical protein A3781_16680 [Bacillus badius]MED0667595.1 hypothetical protein [Bacillus badius]MED4717200.1 hypothetical protein [Bacillus badius]OCS82566.1 hypothetical protein A6M11_10840 [Bacillus badius]